MDVHGWDRTRNVCEGRLVCRGPQPTWGDEVVLQATHLLRPKCSEAPLTQGRQKPAAGREGSRQPRWLGSSQTCPAGHGNASAGLASHYPKPFDILLACKSFIRTSAASVGRLVGQLRKEHAGELPRRAPKLTPLASSLPFVRFFRVLQVQLELPGLFRACGTVVPA